MLHRKEMEINIEAAVRICPVLNTNEDLVYLHSDVYNNTIQLGNAHSFPVHYALPTNCTQNSLFTTTIMPLMNYLFDGCDVSVVTIGQARSGKSYTLLGPTLNCALSEKEYGVIPRFLRQVFSTICENNDKNCTVQIAWTQICGENVQDLLGAGSVECSTVSDAFRLLQLGMANIAEDRTHTLFTVTLEQQWFINTTVQHKISTASFIDLGSCQKMLVMDNNGLTQCIPTDASLLTLQKCVWSLSEVCTSVYNLHNVVPYNQSMLTMLLKDSFGGRAKTLLICCVSPLLKDFMETFYTLQFAMRAQMIKNFVTINSYTTFDTLYVDSTDVFGLQFATNQLFKLVSNAENLFKSLIVTGSLSKNQMEQISQWLTLKQECEDCLSESSEPHRSLDIIEEEIEDRCGSISEECETVCTDEDSQNALQQFDDLMRNFYLQTDTIISTIHKKEILPINAKISNNSYNSEYHLRGARGRRGSIHSAEDIIPSISKTTEELSNQSLEIKLKQTEMNNNEKQKVLKQIQTEIEGCEREIEELVSIIKIKEKLKQQLLKHKHTKVNVGNKLKQRYQKLQNDQFVAQSKLLQAKTQNNLSLEHKYDLEISEISKKLHETELIKDIAEDDIKTIAELESNLNNYKKQLEKLKKVKQKKEKCKLKFESDFKKSAREHETTPKLKKNSAEIRSEKSITSSIIKRNDEISVKDLENVKHEIKQLRKTRDYLLEEKCKMDTKSNNKRLLTEEEEHHVLQCEEAIEAVDLAIEYKNQTLCGTIRSLELASLKDEEEVGKILMRQFMKLNSNEIRFLLQKYFQKVIELRNCSKKLEQQSLEIESQNENLIYQVRNLSRVLQQVRSEAERRIVSLQQKHENKLQLMMHHLSNDGNDKDHVVSHVLERSKQAALAFQVSQAAEKQMDKSSLIARFTQYARHESVPRQLQAALTPSQAKVTRQKNKLIIQQSSK